MVDSAVQVRTNMEEIIAKLRKKIEGENYVNATDEQRGYVIGLADALQIIEEYCSEQLMIGKKYYVITYINKQAKVEHMTLYRINSKKKCAYCFTRNHQYPTPDVVLYSKGGLKLRVFSNYESAQNGIPAFLMSTSDRR